MSLITLRQLVADIFTKTLGYTTCSDSECCSSSQTCVNGTKCCSTETPYLDTNGNCVQCASDAHCGDDKICNLTTYTCEDKPDCNPSSISSCASGASNFDSCVAENQSVCEACGWNWDIKQAWPGFTFYGCGGDDYCKAKYGSSSVWMTEEDSMVVGCWNGSSLLEEFGSGLTGPISI